MARRTHVESLAVTGSVLALCAALAACSSGGGSSPTPPTGGQSSGSKLYVANYENSSNTFPGNILVFDLPLTSGESPAVTLTSPDAGGGFFGLALDGTTELAASDSTPEIDFYTLPLSASSTPSFKITGSATSAAYGLAFDSSGDLVTGANGTLAEYTEPLSSTSTPSATTTVPNSASDDILEIAIHGSTLAVATCPGGGASGAIYIYSLPLTDGALQTATIASAADECYTGVAFASGSSIYATNETSEKIEYYSSLATSSSPAYSFDDFDGIATNLALDSSGNLYLDTQLAPYVYEFAAPSSSTTAYTLSTSKGLGDVPLGMTIGN